MVAATHNVRQFPDTELTSVSMPVRPTVRPVVMVVLSIHPSFPLQVLLLVGVDEAVRRSLLRVASTYKAPVTSSPMVSLLLRSTTMALVVTTSVPSRGNTPKTNHAVPTLTYMDCTRRLLTPLEPSTTVDMRLSAVAKTGQEDAL